MKKLLLAILLVFTMAFSQELAFKQGSNVLNAGLNFNLYSGGVSPGVLVAFDHGAFNNMFSMGGELGFYHRSWDVGYWKNSYTYLSPLFRFGFHPFGIPALEAKGFKALSVIDPYVAAVAGVRLGIYSNEWDWGGERSKKTGTEGVFVIGLKPGIRWFPFNNGVNFWAEANLGYNAFGLLLGAGLRF